MNQTIAAPRASALIELETAARTRLALLGRLGGLELSPWAAVCHRGLEVAFAVPVITPEAMEAFLILSLAGDVDEGPDACLQALRRVAEDLRLLRPEVRP